MIKIIVYINEILNLVKRFIWKYSLPVILILLTGFIYNPKRKKDILNKSNKNIIIMGASFLNKGSQAMIFTVVDQIKKRFPNKSISLFTSFESKKTFKEKKKYNFKIIPWNKRLKIRLSSLFHKINFLFINSKYDHLENKIKNIIENAYLIIDISGYRLSSQTYSGSWISYFLDILIAKKNSIPYFIFPQSIGPFNFPLKYKIFFYSLSKLYLKYPKKIFVRENNGLRYIRQFTKINTKKAYDIVLQNRGFNISNIYNEKIDFKEFQIKPNSVCIIPNRRVIERVNLNDIYSIYKSLIKTLIESKKIIYILRHSYEDLEICQNIKNDFQKNKNVILIPDNLNVIEIEKIIKKFDFIIASRYHSIVQAFKNGIPALVIGWAIKYYELLKFFGQVDYFFNIRKGINITEINEKLKKIIYNYKNEGKKIIALLNTILNKETCFDVLTKGF